jgi:uroporphyrinogen decarboxylase
MFPYRANFLRNASLEGHTHIPALIAISGASWLEDPDGLRAVTTRYPQLFPEGGKEPPPSETLRAAIGERVDEWGCRWRYDLPGLDGIVIEEPLSEWDNLRKWQPPEPSLPDQATLDALKADQDANRLAIGSVGEHGFFFMRLYYLRGFENLMIDVATEDPRLDELVTTIEGYHAPITQAYVRTGVDLLAFADDLGTQKACMLSPAQFRRWLLPTYRRLFAPARQAGIHVYLHADGYFIDVAEPLLETGVSIVNPQDLVNGIGPIAETFKGRACILLDVDRQTILPYGSQSDVRDLIREEVLALGSPAGGLAFVAGIYPPTPAANVEALCRALMEHRTYWAGRG